MALRNRWFCVCGSGVACVTEEEVSEMAERGESSDGDGDRGGAVNPYADQSPAERTDAVVSEAEFPGVGQVWLAQVRRGARVRWARLEPGLPEPDRYRMLIDERTAIVSACHGYYLDGFTQDLAAIANLAHGRGALLYVDAYQTLGTVPVDVKALGVDFLASGTLKFLMGIPGIAFLYVRRELIESLHPTSTGWFGRANPFEFDAKKLDWASSASRFDSGTPPLVNAYVARAGIELIGTNTYEEGVTLPSRTAGSTLVVDFRLRLPLIPGTYSVSSAIAADRYTRAYYDWIDNALIVTVAPSPSGKAIHGQVWVPVDISVHPS